MIFNIKENNFTQMKLKTDIETLNKLKLFQINTGTVGAEQMYF